MFNALRSCCVHRSCLFVVLFTFAFTQTIPLNANPVSANEAFAMRMENASKIITTFAKSNKIK